VALLAGHHGINKKSLVLNLLVEALCNKLAILFRNALHELNGSLIAIRNNLGKNLLDTF